MEKQNDYKEMAEVFYNTYTDCLKYKNKNLEKNINCDNYYNKFKYFSDKYENSNNNNNNH
jgi:hypothetical protein